MRNAAAHPRTVSTVMSSRRPRHVLLVVVAVVAGLTAGCADTDDSTVASSGGPAVQAVPTEQPTATGKPIVPLAIEPRLPGRTLTYKDKRRRFRVTFPADWQIASRRALARINLLAGNLTAVATFPIRPRLQDACSDDVGEPRVEVGDRDALVMVGHDLYSRADLARKRPWPFRLFEQVAVDEAADRPSQHVLFPWPCRREVGVSGLWKTFGDSGRVFTVTAIIGKDASETTQREALAVLNSMEFQDPRSR